MGFAGVSVATLGIGFSANAGEKTWDFETDPFDEFPYIASSQEDYVWGGQGWDDWGAARVNPGGFFSISEATGGTWTIAVLPDIDNGEFVKAFNMKMDLRMGNGTTDRPADGISINFARSEWSWCGWRPHACRLRRWKSLRITPLLAAVPRLKLYRSQVWLFL